MRKGVLLIGLAALPAAQAALENPLQNLQFGEILQKAGEFLQELLRNPNSVYFLVILFLFFLFYGIYSSLLRKISLFEGEGGVGLSTPGKLVVIGLAGLSLLGIVFKYRTADSLAVGISAITNSFGFVGIVMVFLLVFLLVRNGFKDQYFLGLSPTMMGLLVAFIAVVIMSGTSKGAILALAGVGMLIAFIIFIIIKVVRWRSHSGHPSAHDLESIQKDEKKAIAVEKDEKDDEQKAEQQSAEIIKGMESLGSTKYKDGQLLDEERRILAKILSQGAPGKGGAP